MANDFLYTSQTERATELSNALGQIPDGTPHAPSTFSGAWGTLVVTGSHYGGFHPVETDSEIVAVIGAPVLAFTANTHLVDKLSDAGTRAILERLRNGLIDWSSDLSGPFAVVLVDKSENRVVIVTDLLSFVPVYYFQQDGIQSIGTHTDAVAKAHPSHVPVDETSLVDLVLHGIVTYPYTNYADMRQLSPAAVSTLTLKTCPSRTKLSTVPYWLPLENFRYASLEEAAQDLEYSLAWYVKAVTTNMDRVAHLASGGEDSRVLASVIPKEIQRHAFVAADSFNREARIAQRVAESTGSTLHFMHRPRLFYLDGMPSMGRLTGYNAQSAHAHFYGLSNKYGMDAFPAVIGGYFSDSLLKASASRKSSITSRLWFLPELLIGGETRTRSILSSHFPSEHLAEVTNRRIAHYDRIRQLRPKSAHEWFAIWPSSMRKGLPNITTSRRLMASFEPFTSSRLVKLGAGTPASWKANRQLFRLGTKRFLQVTKHIPHGDGRYPYYPWWINGFLQFPTWTLLAAKRLAAASGFQRTYEGPWSDWYGLVKSGALVQAAEPFKDELVNLPLIDSTKTLSDLMEDDSLSGGQRTTILNLCIWFSAGETVHPGKIE